jgi:hypothetical protein
MAEEKAFHFVHFQKMSSSKADLSSSSDGLNKDGISDDLFHLLWSKDEMNFSPSVNIPDTIIYKYGQPVSWFFTASNGHIKKKNKHNLVSSKIEEAFNHNLMGYDVLAYFISMPSEHELARGNNLGTTALIEYFDRDGLNRFLYNHKKDVNGILQRFVDPKTTHNEVIRAIWSPKICLLERAENIHQLHDKRYGLYEKCVTYEGPDYFYQSSPLRGPVLAGQIQKICEAVVAHINEVTFGQKQISRVVFTFKVDSRDRLWLLYSTSIRCKDLLEFKPLGSAPVSNPGEVVRNLVNIDSVIQLSDKITLNPFKTYEKIVPKARKVCISCNKETLENLRHPITYKSIIKHYDHVLFLLKSSISLRHRDKKEDTIAWPPDNEIIEAAGGVGFGALLEDSGGNNRDPAEDSARNSRRKNDHIRYKNLKDIQIPPIISCLHPKLTSETYSRCKDDPLFLNKTVPVCEACYLVYAEFTMLMLEIGENISKLLSPDPLLHSFAVKEATEHSMKRPNSSDWRAISSVNQSRTLGGIGEDSIHFHGSIGTLSSAALSHHQMAKERSIGLRTDDSRIYPNFPDVIRNNNEVNVNLADDSMAEIGTANNIKSPFQGGLLEGDSQSFLNSPYANHHNPNFSYNTEEIQALIAERERRFFKEISLNPQLKDSHPLQHLISTQQKLKLIDRQSGILMSNAASDKPSVFGQKYGSQSKDQYSKYSAYEKEIPYAVNGEIILPSKLKQRKFEKALQTKLKKKEKLGSFISDGAIDMSTEKLSIRSKNDYAQSLSSRPLLKPIEQNVKNSMQYREFLSESLKQIGISELNKGPNKKNNAGVTEMSKPDEMQSYNVWVDGKSRSPVLQNQNGNGSTNDDLDGFSVSQESMSGSKANEYEDDQQNMRGTDDQHSLQSGTGTIGFSVESAETFQLESSQLGFPSYGSLYRDSVEQEESMVKEKSDFLLHQLSQENKS